jgi:hypothetical protein
VKRTPRSQLYVGYGADSGPSRGGDRWHFFDDFLHSLDPELPFVVDPTKGRYAQIAVMSGRRPVVKGRFEAVVNVSSAVMSTAC